jgi:hypothetical protein
MTYIEKVPQPFLDDLVAGQVVPFVGSGLSLNANPPLPTFAAIGSMLASQIPGYTYNNNIIDALAAYQQAFGRTQLIEELAAFLNPPDVQPGETITAFARLPFEQVATTNFDSLLEKAYASLGIQVDPQVTEAQLTVDVAPEGVKLFKFHGDFNHPEDIIVIEEDYDAFVSRFPLKKTYLAYLLTAFTPFFIGYSLDDYDFRTVLRFVGEEINGFQRLGYTVQVGASLQTILQFRRRNVYVINYEGNPATDYPAVLTGLFTELLEYWLDHLITHAIITDHEVANALNGSNPTEKALCLIALNPQKISDYQKNLSSFVAENGYLPCTTNEIYGRVSETVKTYALAKHAKKIISDCTSPFFNYFETNYPGEKILCIDEPDITSTVKAQSINKLNLGLKAKIEQWLSL